MIESERIVNRIVIIGGGASGALVAAQLLRNAGAVPADVVVLEPRGVLGRGIAYDTADPAHLLNVPARAMSGFPDEPDHFRQWAGAQPAEFVSRSRYGDYLGESLDGAVAGAPTGSRLLHVRSRAIDIQPGADGQLRVFDDRGDVYVADHVVIATGHDQPAIPAGIAAELLNAAQVLADPWDPGGLDSIGPGERVICVGSGLTFVDVALTVLAAAPDTSVVSVSRQGLLPAAHVYPLPVPDPPLELPEGQVPLEPILQRVRDRDEQWRSAIDGLRPQTQQIWLRLSPSDRDRLMTGLVRQWDIHRHRMAPPVADAMGAHIADGRIAVVAAPGFSAQLRGDTVVLGTADGELMADRLVVCTGPQSDVTLSQLGRSLVDAGRARRGPYGIGYDVDPASGALIDASGHADDRIIAMGPLRRGVLFESTAIPEISVQARDVAARIVSVSSSA